MDFILEAGGMGACGESLHFSGERSRNSQWSKEPQLTGAQGTNTMGRCPNPTGQGPEANNRSLANFYYREFLKPWYCGGQPKTHYETAAIHNSLTS